MPRRDYKVFFRITEQEYQKVQEACAARGITTVSEFVRAALDDLLKFDWSVNSRDRLPRLQARIKVPTAEAELLACRTPSAAAGETGKQQVKNSERARSGKTRAPVRTGVLAKLERVRGAVISPE